MDRREFIKTVVISGGALAVGASTPEVSSAAEPLPQITMKLPLAWFTDSDSEYLTKVVSATFDQYGTLFDPDHSLSKTISEIMWFSIHKDEVTSADPESEVELVMSINGRIPVSGAVVLRDPDFEPVSCFKLNHIDNQDVPLWSVQLHFYDQQRSKDPVFMILPRRKV